MSAALKPKLNLELNMDGLVGPTHNYGGLSAGNLASGQNKGQIANPRQAALQGLSKMRALLKLGLPQAIMPPQERPFLPGLRRLGFCGSDRNILTQAWSANPALLRNYSSASSMWAANAATVSPSADCADGRVHITPANLCSMPHRAIEAQSSTRLLRAIFSDPDYFAVHEALPAQPLLSDEGAANHNRLARAHDAAGLEIFVYGREALSANAAQTRLPARQSLEASQAIARRHGLSPERALHIRQSARAIDAGAFHNDVVCVSNGPVLLFHEYAFDDVEAVKSVIMRRSDRLGFTPNFIMACNDEMPLDDAITSYFFNSQLVTKPCGAMVLILPIDAQEIGRARAFAQKCVEGEGPIDEAIFLDLRQSMRNGGGPACLRLRLALTPAELSKMHQAAVLDAAKIDRLEDWVRAHYRDRLGPEDLGDPDLLTQSQTALDELSKILRLGSVYAFQTEGA